MTPMLVGVSSTIRINFCGCAFSCGVADIVSLQFERQPSSDARKRLERVGVSEVADVSDEAANFCGSQDFAKIGSSIKDEIGSVAVVILKKPFQLGEGLHHDRGIGGGERGAIGHRLVWQTRADGGE